MKRKKTVLNKTTTGDQVCKEYSEELHAEERRTVKLELVPQSSSHTLI